MIMNKLSELYQWKCEATASARWPDDGTSQVAVQGSERLRSLIYLITVLKVKVKDISK
jgi:hypothetical protein